MRHTFEKKGRFRAGKETDLAPACQEGPLCTFRPGMAHIPRGECALATVSSDTSFFGVCERFLFCHRKLGVVRRRFAEHGVEPYSGALGVNDLYSPI